jgi:Fe-S cluster biogenesis protein NfuA
MTEIQKRIEDVLAETIRPWLQASGGNVRLDSVGTYGVATIALEGTCQSCPATAMSLLMHLEAKLREHVPEVAYIEVARQGD